MIVTQRIRIEDELFYVSTFQSLLEDMYRWASGILSTGLVRGLSSPALSLYASNPSEAFSIMEHDYVEKNISGRKEDGREKCLPWNYVDFPPHSADPRNPKFVAFSTTQADGKVAIMILKVCGAEVDKESRAFKELNICKTKLIAFEPYKGMATNYPFTKQRMEAPLLRHIGPLTGVPDVHSLTFVTADSALSGWLEERHPDYQVLFPELVNEEDCGAELGTRDVVIKQESRDPWSGAEDKHFWLRSGRGFLPGMTVMMGSKGLVMLGPVGYVRPDTFISKVKKQSFSRGMGLFAAVSRKGEGVYARLLPILPPTVQPLRVQVDGSPDRVAVLYVRRSGRGGFLRIGAVELDLWKLLSGKPPEEVREVEVPLSFFEAPPEFFALSYEPGNYKDAPSLMALTTASPSLDGDSIIVWNAKKDYVRRRFVWGGKLIKYRIRKAEAERVSLEDLWKEF